GLFPWEGRSFVIWPCAQFPLVGGRTPLRALRRRAPTRSDDCPIARPPIGLNRYHLSKGFQTSSPAHVVQLIEHVVRQGDPVPALTATAGVDALNPFASGGAI